jgi:NAD(P)-dependent dehydrogenase (short-subunit alcohol dehydrogenase family)
VAVVTGSASGIGLGLAERFAAEGMRGARGGPVLRRGQEIVAGGPPAPPVSFA